MGCATRQSEGGVGAVHSRAFAATDWAERGRAKWFWDGRVMAGAGGGWILLLGCGRDARAPGEGGSETLPYVRKPRLGLAKRPMFGKAMLRFVGLTPNHVARVALYSSTLVVGIQRPWVVSSGPPMVGVGILP